MTRLQFERITILIVGVCTVAETFRLYSRLPLGSIGLKVVSVQLVLLLGLALRSLLFRFSRVRLPDQRGQMRRWFTFYYCALAILIVNSFWNLCLFLS